MSRLKNEDKFDNNIPKGNKKNIVRLLVWLLLFIFVFYQTVQLALYTIGKVNKEDMWLYNSVNVAVSFVKEKFQSKNTLNDYSLNMAALGDVYATSSQITNSKGSKGYDFSDLNQNISPTFKKYDLVLASLNSPIAASSLGYSNKSTRNSPEEMLEMLNSIGVSAVLTATTHIYDKSEKGIVDTIEAIKKNNLSQFGINGSKDREKPLIVEKNSIKVGLLSYTTQSNVKLPDAKDYLINFLDEATLKQDIKYLKEQKADFIVAYLCVPSESAEFLTKDQKADFDMLFSNGVDLVFGTGTNVFQGKVEDLYDISETDQNHVYGIYSLGDFYGVQDTTQTSISLIGDITFTKTVEKDNKGNIVSEKKDLKFNKPSAIYAKSKTGKVNSLYLLEEVIKQYNDDKFDITFKEYNNIEDELSRFNELY